MSKSYDGYNELVTYLKQRYKKSFLGFLCTYRDVVVASLMSTFTTAGQDHDEICTSRVRRRKVSEYEIKKDHILSDLSDIDEKLRTAKADLTKFISKFADNNKTKSSGGDPISKNSDKNGSSDSVSEISFGDISNFGEIMEETQTGDPNEDAFPSGASPQNTQRKGGGWHQPKPAKLIFAVKKRSIITWDRHRENAEEKR
ncbi:14854_t:CDS:2, partial [Funneliformis caledonium]